MKTTDCNGRPEHPEDLLRRFRGRIALLDALGYAAIDCHWAVKERGILFDVPVSEPIATGLRALYEDFEDLERGILAWVEAGKKPGDGE